MVTYSVALTGGIGSGKTTVANLFKEKSIPVIDSDDIVKKIMARPSIRRKIVRALGRNIINRSGGLCVKQLRQALLYSPQKKRCLERILHPPVWLAIKHFISQCAAPYCIIVIPLLFETKPQYAFNKNLVIDAPQYTRIRRIQQRSQWPLSNIKAMLKLQVSRQQRQRQAHDIINNVQSLKYLCKQVEQLHEKYSAFG